MSKSFPELIRLLAVAGRQHLGLCTSGPMGAGKKGFPTKGNQNAAESGFHSHKEPEYSVLSYEILQCLSCMVLASLVPHFIFLEIEECYPPQKKQVKN